MKYPVYRAVINALFSLQAFDRFRRKPTKQVADTSNLPQNTAREALKDLERTGLVEKYPSAQSHRLVWIARKVKGKRSTSYKKLQYLDDAAKVQRLARSNPDATKLLGTEDLTTFDVKNNDTQRNLFNAIVKVLIKAGHLGLPTYEFAGGSFYWWLKTTSREAADKILRQISGKRKGRAP